MNRSSIIKWISAAALCVGFAGSARADAWDRDHEVGRGRAQEFKAQVSAKDSMPARPSAETSVTGRALGQDTVTKGAIGREFRNQAEMMAHMNTATKMRVSSEGEATDEGSTTTPSRKAAKASNPAQMAAHEARGNEKAYESQKPSDRTLHESQNSELTETSITGRKLGQDTVTKGAQYRNFKDRADMMAHLNTATAMRISGEAGSEGDTSGGGVANAGRSQVSDPTKLTDKQRKQLAAEGLVMGKKASSADVEDKTM